MLPNLPSLSIPSPLQLLQDELLHKKNIRLFLKRDDLIHPEITGNKWRKLKYNLQDFFSSGKDSLLTFGGTYSNHIRATAAAGKTLGIPTIGIIRGDAATSLNPALRFAQDCGMHLHFINRETYRKRQDSDWLAEIQVQFSNCYILPEGGTNALAVKGCAEIIAEIEQAFDLICCPCGTGGTLAGLVDSLPSNTNTTAMGFAVLKGGTFLQHDIQLLLGGEYQRAAAARWSLNLDYHFGGYAKTNPLLLDFIRWFQETHGVALDYVYNGKMLFGLWDMIENGAVKPGQTIVALITGGLANASIF